MPHEAASGQSFSPVIGECTGRGGCQAGKAKKQVTMGARPSVRMIGKGVATLELRKSHQAAERLARVDRELHYFSHRAEVQPSLYICLCP